MTADRTGAMRRVIPVAVVCMAASLAACGGAAELTPSQTRSRAQAMCSAAVSEIPGAFAALGSGQGITAGQIVKLARTGAGVADRIDQGLRSLKAPARLAAELRSLTSLNAQTATFERQLADAFTGRPFHQQVAFSEIDRYYQPIQRQASKAELLAATGIIPSLCVAQI